MYMYMYILKAPRMNKIHAILIGKRRFNMIKKENFIRVVDQFIKIKSVIITKNTVT